MYGHIQYVIKKDGGILVVEAKRYGEGFLVGIDFNRIDNATRDKDVTIVYDKDLSEAIEEATAPGDINADIFVEKLRGYAVEHKEFLYVESEYLDLALKELNSRCEKWKNLTHEEQINLLCGFVDYESVFYKGLKKW